MTGHCNSHISLWAGCKSALIGGSNLVSVGCDPSSVRLRLLLLPSSLLSGVFPPIPCSVWGFMSLSLGWIATDAALPECIWVCLYVSVTPTPHPPSLPQLSHIAFPLLFCYSSHPFIQTFSRMAELQIQHLCRWKTWCASLPSRHKSQIFFLKIFFSDESNQFLSYFRAVCRSTLSYISIFV